MKDTDKELEDKMWEYVKARGGRKLIRKILIANNGMASTKTIMSIRNWAYNTFGDERAIKFVVMATPEDLAANAEFIRRADEFVQVPGGSNANNYANVQLIVDLCISQGVDALMVGWGHASENPKLGDLLSAKNAELGLDITFVGPQSPVMRILGDKIGANLVVATLRVAIQDILNSTHTEEYETQVIYTLLLSLGVDPKKADEISNIPFDQLPDLPKKGLVGKILKLAA